MDEALINDFPPGTALKMYIRKYQVIRLIFKKDHPLPIKYHTPHPEHCITFYLKDHQSYSLIGSQEVIAYPKCVINGIYTIPLNRHGGYDFLALKVVLQPGILFCLTGFSALELTNSFIDAEALWEKEVRVAYQQLIETEGLPEMISVLESFLINLFKHHFKKNLHPIDKASQLLFLQKQSASITWLADQSCLSTRQFIRKFEERQGISAKSFERMVRFDKAYRMKNKNPKLDWLQVAIECGYCDYQHLAKDFKEFTNLTPQGLFELERYYPERSLGLFEC